MSQEESNHSGERSEPAERTELGVPPSIFENDLYDIVQAYAAAQTAASDDWELLQEWIIRYPQFRDELAAVSWQAWTKGPDRLRADWLSADDSGNAGEEPEEDPELIAAGHAALAFLLPETNSALPAANSELPLVSLLAAAKAKGLSARDFAQALRLDIPLLARLEQRLIRAATIPRSLVERIAQTVDFSVADVANYLRGGPSLAASAHYKAMQAPRAGEQIDFLEILKSSSADARTFWEGPREVLGEEELL